MLLMSPFVGRYELVARIVAALEIVDAGELVRAELGAAEQVEIHVALEIGAGLDRVIAEEPAAGEEPVVGLHAEHVVVTELVRAEK